MKPNSMVIFESRKRLRSMRALLKKPGLSEKHRKELPDLIAAQESIVRLRAKAAQYHREKPQAK